jgi:RND family efflux transporter MFP subunit|tara:strand:+ start:332 stop:1495 length:1164 start_codon:yes stop_codon:yes gene_type:complete
MIKRFLAPIIVLVVGVGLAALIIASGPKLEPQAPPSSAPLVRTWEAASQSVQLTSITHGTVLPRTESDLIPEISGRIISISKSMVSGGFFKKDDLLLVIDPLDYELAREQARASLASAGSELSNAKRGHDRQLDLARKQSTSQSKKDDALNRLRFAQASLREAKARLSRAERDLSRTKITAPYDGRVRSERVDIGQFANRGTPMASLYATDIAEVRLPIHDEELAHLELPLANQITGQQRPTVILSAPFAGKKHTWRGAIVRTEGEIDPKTRMITVIAQVESPYETKNDRPPLAVGLFVEAEIIGHKIGNVFVLPRSAIQANRQVYVIGKDNRLQFRDVEILRTVGEEVYITGGLNARETVCLSTVSNAIEGMLVRPAPAVELQASK